MLESLRLPYLDSSNGGGDNPAPKYDDLADGLVQVAGKFESGCFVASSRNEKSLRFPFAWVSKSSNQILLPRYRSSNLSSGFRPRDPDAIESTVQTVGYERFANGGGQLKIPWVVREWDISCRHES